MLFANRILKRRTDVVERLHENVRNALGTSLKKNEDKKTNYNVGRIVLTLILIM